MNATRKVAGGAVGVLVGMTVVGLVPAASADNPDTGRARNDINYGNTDLGKARNDIGPLTPDSGGTSPSSSSYDASDIAIGTLAGLLVAGGGAGAVICIRRRHAATNHAA